MADAHYPPEFVAGLEMQWGAGYLSPGGPEEVTEILRNVAVADKTVLDIGCGIAGPAIMIASELAPSKVIGIDIESFLIQKGTENVTTAKLSDLINLQLVSVGPLPFADESFDVVFSKDSLIHVEDKSELYKEVLRVLKPGGVFAASDWLRGENADELYGYNEWRSLAVLDFTMQTDRETRTEMTRAGLKDVETRERQAWYVESVSQEVAMMRKPEWRSLFVEAFGEDGYHRKLAVRSANGRAAEYGGLIPTHLCGTK